MFTVEDAARDLANLVKSIERDYFFVRGDLENRVGGRVNDGLACFDVLFPELLDDIRAGSSFLDRLT